MTVETLLIELAVSHPAERNPATGRQLLRKRSFLILLRQRRTLGTSGWVHSAHPPESLEERRIASRSHRLWTAPPRGCRTCCLPRLGYRGSHRARPQGHCMPSARHLCRGGLTPNDVLFTHRPYLGRGLVDRPFNLLRFRPRRLVASCADRRGNPASGRNRGCGHAARPTKPA